MTLKDALESGRPFRRGYIHEGWLTCDEVKTWTWNAEQILSTDWEVKPEEPKPREWDGWVSSAGNIYTSVATIQRSDDPKIKVIELLPGYKMIRESEWAGNATC